MLPRNFDIADKWCYIRAKHWFIACSVRLKFVYRLYRLLFIAMVFWWLLLLRKKVDDVKEKGKDTITWKILNIEDLESGETPSVTWPWNEQWRCVLYKIKALWESSSREMSGSIYCLAPACLHCISAFSAAPNNTSQVQIEGRVSLVWTFLSSSVLLHSIWILSLWYPLYNLPIKNETKVHFIQIVISHEPKWDISIICHWGYSTYYGNFIIFDFSLFSFYSILAHGEN